MFRKALLLTDLQNDFFEAFGEFSQGALGVTGSKEILEPVFKIIWCACQNQWLVVASRDWHEPNSPHFKKWPVHCVKDTKGAEFHPGVIFPTWTTIVVSKGIGNGDGYSPFEVGIELGILTPLGILSRIYNPLNDVYRLVNNLVVEKNQNTLAKLLCNAGVEKVFNLGLATDYCVKAGTIDAAKLGFKTYVLLDACRAVNLKPNDEQRAVEDMEAAGAIMTTVEEVVSGKLF